MAGIGNIKSSCFARFAPQLTYISLPLLSRELVLTRAETNLRDARGSRHCEMSVHSTLRRDGCRTMANLSPQKSRQHSNGLLSYTIRLYHRPIVVSARANGVLAPGDLSSNSLDLSHHEGDVQRIGLSTPRNSGVSAKLACSFLCLPLPPLHRRCQKLRLWPRFQTPNLHTKSKTKLHNLLSPSLPPLFSVEAINSNLF